MAVRYSVVSVSLGGLVESWISSAKGPPLSILSCRCFDQGLILPAFIKADVFSISCMAFSDHSSISGGMLFAAIFLPKCNVSFFAYFLFIYNIKLGVGFKQYFFFVVVQRKPCYVSACEALYF